LPAVAWMKIVVFPAARSNPEPALSALIVDVDASGKMRSELAAALFVTMSITEVVSVGYFAASLPEATVEKWL